MNIYRRSGMAAGILFIAAAAAGVLSLPAQSPLDAPDYLTGISANEPTVLLSAFLFLERRTWVGDVAALPAWCIGAYLYYALFYKARLVPRWLSLWGLVGITLTVAASLLVLFRQIAPLSTAQLVLNLPIAPQEMVLAAWLIVKGFSPSAIAEQQA